jgi:opacity protein-like surface antigen
VSAQDQLQDGATQFRENVSKKYNSWGFVPGVGARISLTKAVSLKAEYKYALHRSKTITASAANPAVGGTDTGTLKTAPRIQTFHVGVVYSF